MAVAGSCAGASYFTAAASAMWPISSTSVRASCIEHNWAISITIPHWNQTCDTMICLLFKNATCLQYYCCVVVQQLPLLTLVMQCSTFAYSRDGTLVLAPLSPQGACRHHEKDRERCGVKKTPRSADQTWLVPLSPSMS